MPASIIVHAPRRDLERSFAAIIGLQPVEWTDEGVLCVPRTAPDLAAAALANCPFPVAAGERVPSWPRTEARLLAGWYLRGREHAPGPTPARELLQEPGDGFGPGGHVTTAMCLAALAYMPGGPALDAGCGSGLLSQAWAQTTGYEVIACDPDHAAITQAARSCRAAGMAELVDLRLMLVQGLSAEDVSGRVVLANLPAAGHRALLERLPAAPPGVVASGVHGEAATRVRDAYRDLGMRLVSAGARGRWRCWGLIAS